MNNRIAALELQLIHENIDNVSSHEKMSPENIENYRDRLNEHTDITWLEKLLEITRDKITRSAISLIPPPANTEFGTPIELDPNFLDPQRQNNESELYDKYLVLANRIQTDIDLIFIIKHPSLN